MTASALTRPGQRERLSEKIGELDWKLASLLAFVAGMGALMLYSIAGGSWDPWAGAHLTRFCIFFVMMLGLALIDLRVWFAAAYPIYAAALLLLLAVEAVGEVRMGARRWLDLGFTSLQPSEIMKIGVVLALARWYHGATAQEARFHWKLIVPAAMVGVPVLLVAHQPDLGTAILVAITGGSIMFMAGLSWKIIIALGAAGLAALPPFITFVLHDYQRQRIMTFLNPEADPSGSGYHIIQAKTAIGSGGLLGKGYGLGSQSQLDFLPEKQTDFILATVGEEFGFVGTFAVLLVMGLVVASTLRIASLSHSHFGRLGAAGVIATFASYVVINGAMVMGLAPVVGVPQPLLSYGGTVMLSLMIGFGLVMGVRVHRYQELPSGRGQLI